MQSDAVGRLEPDRGLPVEHADQDNPEHQDEAHLALPQGQEGEDLRGNRDQEVRPPPAGHHRDARNHPQVHRNRRRVLQEQERQGQGQGNGQHLRDTQECQEQDPADQLNMIFNAFLQLVSRISRTQ